MTKYDVKKDLSRLYSPKNTDFALIEVPEQRFLAVDGHGDPNTAPAYSEAVEALYAVAYSLKFLSKNELDQDYVVGPLEGFWRSENPADFVTRNKSNWDWTMAIVVPSWITDHHLEEARVRVAAKKNPAALSAVRLIAVAEGTAVQVLHIGSYDDEAPTLARLHDEYMPSNGLTFNGDHHEVYLGDPRKVEPSRLKTVIRQPVRKV